MANFLRALRPVAYFPTKEFKDDIREILKFFIEAFTDTLVDFIRVFQG